MPSYSISVFLGTVCTFGLLLTGGCDWIVGPPFTACSGARCEALADTLSDDAPEADVDAAVPDGPGDLAGDAGREEAEVVDGPPEAEPPIEAAIATGCGSPATCGDEALSPPQEYCVLTGDGGAAVLPTPSACATCETYNCGCFAGYAATACGGTGGSGCSDQSVGFASVRVVCP